MVLHTPEYHYSVELNLVYFNDQEGIQFVTDIDRTFGRNNWSYNSPTSGVAHELIHAYNEWSNPSAYKTRKADEKSTKGKLIGFNGRDFSYKNAEEKYTTELTNKINQNLNEYNHNSNEGIRTHYKATGYPTISVTSTEKKKQ